MTSGSAPISSKVKEFFKVVCSCPFTEGYGQTETTGLGCSIFKDDHSAGNVGGIGTHEGKLVDIT